MMYFLGITSHFLFYSTEGIHTTDYAKYQFQLSTLEPVLVNIQLPVWIKQAEAYQPVVVWFEVLVTEKVFNLLDP